MDISETTEHDNFNPLWDVILTRQSAKAIL